MIIFPLKILLESVTPHAQAWFWLWMLPSPASRGGECSLCTLNLKEDHVLGWWDVFPGISCTYWDRTSVFLGFLEAGMIQVWKFWTISVERSVLERSYHGREKDMKKREKQDPAVLFEPLDLAIPETKLPWTFALHTYFGHLLLP